MSEDNLEKVMIEFLHRKSHILLCTSIVESGLDVPNANTMIVNRADTFGLAQLYQLRGRIGRSDRQAYCYLLVPEEEVMTVDAKRRLQAMTRHTELGSGFQIASQDLEIRGSGNLLGSAQSGFIEEIGYELYTRLLGRTIRKLKGEKVLEEIEPEIQLGLPAFFPSHYIPDSQIRIDLYKRLSNATDEKDLENLRQEWTDRFGPLPIETENLFHVVEIKQTAQSLRITYLRYERGKLVVDFDPSTPLTPQALILLATTRGEVFQLKPPGKLVVSFSKILKEDQIVIEIKKTLRELKNCA